MRHTDLVNALASLVADHCADSVKDALAAVCAANASACLLDNEPILGDLWAKLAAQLDAIHNLGV